MKNGNGKESVTLKIEKGIPIPPHAAKRSKGYTAAIRQLKVGDSVLLPCGQQTAYNLASSVFGQCCVTTRRDGDGVRVWRTK